MFITTTISIVLVTIVLIAAWVKRKYSFWKEQNILTPPLNIGWGHLKQPILKKISFAEALRDCYKFFKSRKVKHGGIYSYIFPAYMPVDLDIIKSILLTDFDHFSERGFYMNEDDDPMSFTIFSMSGDQWKLIRPKFTAAFSPAKLKVMCDAIVKCGEDFSDALGDEDIKDMDIKRIIDGYTMNIIGECAFGVNCNALKEPNGDFLKYGRAFFQRSLLENIKIQMTEIAPDLMKKLHTCITKPSVTEFFTLFTKQTMEYREKNNITKNDCLDILMNLRSKGEKQNVDEDVTSENSLPFEKIAGLAYSLFLVSFETTSNTIYFILYLLSVHGDVQEKAREEVKRVMDRYNNKLTYESLSDFIYLDMIINESMRMYPPVHHLYRRCTEDYKVPGTGLTLKKGQKVFIPVMGIHYDEEYYPDPEKFDPERFSAENSRERHPAEFLPFGLGPKYCLAPRFGTIQVKILLIMILKKYEMSLSARTKIPFEFGVGNHITLESKDAVYLNLKKIPYIDE